jgi:Protein of unknown function (DUF3089)/CHRD domain
MARPLRALLGAVLLAAGSAVVAAPATGQTAEEPVVLQTTLTGLREVAPDGSLGAGDPDGVGAATLEVTSTSLCATINVSGIDLPAVAAHVHQAEVGVNGPIVVPLTAPGGDGLAVACADAPDPAVLAGILADPQGFYVNVHTAAFPDGAVRGQLQPAPDEGLLLATRLTGAEEVGPAGEPAVGDPDGSGIATVAVSTEARRACFELSVQGVVLPAAAAHIHAAPPKVNGYIVVPLTAPDAAGRSSGCARGIDPAVVEGLVQTPSDYYVNVHTTDFPSGALRGQLAAATAFAGNEDLYDDAGRWLCHPDLPASSNVCHEDLDATSVAADGTLTAEPQEPADAPAFDCFYVYPTVQLGTEGNAPFEGDHANEVYTARAQAARFSSACEVYAPLYRQVTLGADRGGPINFGALAYADVAAAFRSYLEGVDDGRPFLLLGHSQGSSHLRRLVAEQIDNDPALRDRFLSAMLLGTTVSVPVGGDVGGSFSNVPACRTAGQHGCVVAYASFRDRVPPPENSLFGRSSLPGNQALCTDPQALSGTDLVSYFDIAHDSPFAPANPRLAWDPALPDPPAITTPFVALPGLVSSRCVSDGTFSYLELTNHPDPGPRADDIPGDLTPEWGMHLVDVDVAQGNLIDIAEAQAAAWAADR